MSMPYPQQPAGQPVAPYAPGQPAAPYRARTARPIRACPRGIRLRRKDLRRAMRPCLKGL